MSPIVNIYTDICISNTTWLGFSNHEKWAPVQKISK